MSQFFFLLSFLTSLWTTEIDLSLHEKSLYSQNGEDGVLAKIFQVIEPKTLFCVEFGSYDGITGSNLHLLRLQGWKCVQFDRQYQIPRLNLHREFLTAENINQIFEKYEIPHDLDLLSIHIHYNDFYLWAALDPKYRPAVIVIEYNASHLPQEDKVVKYRPFYIGDNTRYYGASMLALYHLGRAKGYSLVYAEASGTHLFFIRDDLLTDLSFKNSNDVKTLYRFPSGSRPEDDRHRPYLTSEEILR